MLYFGLVSNIDIENIYQRILFFIKVSLTSSLVVMLWGIPGKFGFDLSCKLFTGSLKTACWTNEFQPTIRMFSTLGQPNWLGIYLVINMLFAIHLLLSRHIRKTWLLYIYLFLSSISIMFTQSRSAFLALGCGLVGVGTYIAMTKIFKKDKKEYVAYIKSYLLPLAIVLVCSLGIGYAVNKQAFIKIAAKVEQPAASNNITDSFAIRKLVWQGAYSVGLKYPLFGTGVETFAYSYNFLRPNDHNMTSEWDFVYNKAHNELLNYFSTTGLFGIVTYLVLIGVVIARIKYVWDEEDESKQLLEIVLLSAFASIVVSNFFGFSTTTINIFFYLIPAFVTLLIFKGNKHVVEESELLTLNLIQKAMLAIPFTIFLYGVSFLSLYFMADVHYARGENYRSIQEYDQALFYLYYADSLKSEHVYEDKISQVLAQKGFFSSYLNHSQNPLCPTSEGENEPCFELAQKYNDQTLKASPKNVYYLRSKARNNFLAYQASRDEATFDSSIKAITQAQELAPTDPRYPYMKSLFFLGKYDSEESPGEEDKDMLKFRAIGPATLAIKLKPDYKDAYITRGLISSDLGDFKAARDDFKYILEKIDPQDEQAKAELAKIENR
jgi:tetratricopeptide (TPR) repeat protein